MKQKDTLLDELSAIACDSEDCTLAKTHAPQLRFDANEPFFPLAVGYTVFRTASKSPSSKFTIEPNNGIVIEYAIWWDWDIQHLYELEHIWVYLDADKNLLKVEASAHGNQYAMLIDDEALPLEDGRITLYSEPGKHGFVAQPEWFEARKDHTIESCTDKAGEGGVHISNPFGAETLGNPTLLQHRLAKRYMQRLAFTPTFDFSEVYDLRDVPFVTWDTLQDWIPRRVSWWLSELERTVPHLRLICLDSGDTIMDEGTEEKENDVGIRAELIPGADEMLRRLQQEGYLMALVADGPGATFENILTTQHGLWDYFSAHAVSGDVGVMKPHPRMFHTVLNALDIPESDYGLAAMVGNNLERDIKGANDTGLISIWLSWSPRRSKIPADDSQVPDYTIAEPLDLLPMLEKIELSLPNESEN